MCSRAKRQSNGPAPLIRDLSIKTAQSRFTNARIEDLTSRTLPGSVSDGRGHTGRQLGSVPWQSHANWRVDVECAFNAETTLDVRRRRLYRIVGGHRWWNCFCRFAKGQAGS